MKKNILTLLIAFIAAIQVSAQTTFQKEIRTVDPTFGLYGARLSKMKDGNYIITRMFTPGALSTILLNNAGDIIWTRTFNDPNYLNEYAASSAVQAPDKGYLIVFSGGYLNTYDTLFLLKFNRQGKLLWQKKINKQGTAFYNISRLTLGTDGTALLCGNGALPDGNSAFLAKIDAVTGNIIWFKTMETNKGKSSDGGESLGDVFPTKDTGAIVCGSSARTGGTDIIYAKYNKTGQCTWIKKIFVNGSYENCYFSNVVETLDNGFLFTGKNYYNSSFNTPFILKTDGAGNVIWTKSLVGNSKDIARNNDSSFTIVGDYTANNDNKTSGYIINISKDGSVARFFSLSSVIKRDVGFGTVKQNASGYVIGGQDVKPSYGNDTKFLFIQTDSAGFACNFTPGNLSSFDITASYFNFTLDTSDVTSAFQTANSNFVLRNFAFASESFCSSLSALPAQDEQAKANAAASFFSIKIFPNPVVANQLNLSVASLKTKDVHITIATTAGNIVYSQKLSASSGSFSKIIDITSWAKGMYVLKATNGEEQKIMKFVKAE